MGEKGFGALGLVSGSGLSATVTKYDDEYVNIQTRGYSDSLEDVTLRLIYTLPIPSAPQVTVEKKLSVKTMKLLIFPDFVQHFPNGSGWRTWMPMAATDQFGALIPTPVDINELFTNWESLWQGETWPPPIIQGFLAGARQWTDQVTMPGPHAYTPQPVTPSSGDASTPIDRATQTWRYGSLTQGAGNLFIDGSVTFQRNRGFAEHSN